MEDTINVKRDLYGIKTIMSRYSNNFGQLRVFLLPNSKVDWYEIAYEKLIVERGLYESEVMIREVVIDDI